MKELQYSEDASQHGSNHITKLLRVHRRKSPSLVGSCGVEQGVRTCRKTPSAYNWSRASYDNPRWINSTLDRNHFGKDPLKAGYYCV